MRPAIPAGCKCLRGATYAFGYKNLSNVGMLTDAAEGISVAGFYARLTARCGPLPLCALMV